MVTRKIVLGAAVLLILVGLSQLIVSKWWLEKAKALVDSNYLHLWGLIGVVLGVVLLLAVLERAVGLRLFVAILALLNLGVGLAILVSPQFFRDLAYAVVFDRSPGIRVFVMYVGGILRVTIGALLIYAAIKYADVTLAEPAETPPKA
jgi:hypothetical protein